MVQDVLGSTTGLELAFALIGLFMGFVFALSSWRGSLKGGDLKSDPRVKSFVWAVAGLSVALISDWKRFIGEDVDRVRLLCFYSIPLVVVALGIVLAITLTIRIRFSAMRKRSPAEYPAEPFSPALDYLYYGYQYYMERSREALEEKRNDRLNKLLRFRDLGSRSANYLAGDILAVNQYLLKPTPELRAIRCRQILEHICLTVQSHMEPGTDPNLNASLMVAIPVAEATRAHRDSVRFAYGDHARYGHLLVLTEYAYPRGQEHFALPVEDRARTPNWQEWVLLGAPESFLREKELVIQTQHLDFAERVPQDIREKIGQYFEGKGFRSFACLVILGDGALRGIVNVESSEEHIFQTSKEVQNEVARQLQPFCTLLGLIVR